MGTDIGIIQSELTVEEDLIIDLNGRNLTIIIAEGVGQTSNGIKIELVPHQVRNQSRSARIFVVRWRGKTEGMLAAFRGFTAPHDGKKTGEIL